MSPIDNEPATDIVVPNSGQAPAASDSAASAPANQGSDPADASNEVPADASPEEKRFQKSEYQRLQRQRGNAERRALRAESLAASLEARIKALEAGTTPKSADLRPSDFGDYDKFVDKKIDLRVEEKLGERLKGLDPAEREATRAAQTAYEAIMADEEAEAAGVDLDAVWDTLRKQPYFPQPIFDLVAESDHPARLLEYLAENPSELDRVSRLGHAMAEKALAKMQASLPKLKASKPNATDVPPPPPKVGGRGASQFDPDAVSDMEQYKAYWNERRFGKKG